MAGISAVSLGIARRRNALVPADRKKTVSRKRLVKSGSEWALQTEAEGDFVEGLRRNVEARTKGIRASGTGGTGGCVNEDEYDSLSDSDSFDYAYSQPLPPQRGEMRRASAADAEAVRGSWMSEKSEALLPDAREISLFCVHPRQPWKVRWDIFVGLMVVYSLLVLPFRIAFEQEAKGTALVLEYCVEVSFALDLVLCFCTGYYTAQGVYVSSPRSIAKTYLLTFFIPDVLSCFPVELMIGDVSWIDQIKMFKFVRLVRLMKLMRLLKIQKYLLERLDLNPNVVHMVNMLVQVVVLVHLLTCLWYFIATPVCGESFDLPHDPCPDGNEARNWVRTFGVDHFKPLARYIASFHLVTATMLGVGYGDIYATNTKERLLSIFMQLVGATVIGFILSGVTRLLDSASAQDIEYKRQMAEVREWCLGRQLPWQLRNQIRDHFVYALSKKSIFNEAAILGNMPTHLRAQMMQHSYSKWLHLLQVRFGREDAAMRAGLLLALTPRQVFYEEVVLETGEICPDVLIVSVGLLEAVCDATSPLPSVDVWPRMALKLNRSKRRETRRFSTTISSSSSTYFARLGKSVLGKFGLADERRSLGAFNNGGQDMRSLGRSRIGTLTSAPPPMEDLEGQMLCGVFGEGDLFGQFPACPMTVQGTQMRCELLCCSKNVLFCMLCRFPGALVRYKEEEAIELKELLSVLNSSEAVETEGPPRTRRSKSIVLARGKARPLSCLPAELFPPPDAEEANDDWEAMAPDTPFNGNPCDSRLAPSPPPPSDMPDYSFEDFAALAHDALINATLPGRIPDHVPEDSPSHGQSPKTARSGTTEAHKTTNLGIKTQSMGRTATARLFRAKSLPTIQTVRLNVCESLPEVVDETEEQILARWILPPFHQYKLKWDLVAGCLIIYSVLTIPFRICFNVEPSPASIAFDLLVDVLFTADLIISFRTAFVDADGIVNTIPNAIWRRYLAGEFWVDFLSVVPSDHAVDIWMSTTSTGSGGQSKVRAFKLVRIVRLTRFFKLVRMLKMGRLLETLEDQFAISPLFIKVASLGIRLIFVAHLLGCFWFYVSSDLDPSEDACSTGRLVDCNVRNTTWWWEQVNIEKHQTTDQYIAALYWAVTTMTTVGYGDVTPKNTPERIYAIITMILGATVFSYIIGTIAALVGQDHGIEALAKKQVTLIREFCEEQCMGKRRMQMVRLHYQFHYQHRPPLKEASLLSQLPGAIRKQAMLHIHRHSIARIGLFVGVTLKGLPHGPLPDWFVAWTMMLLEPQAIAAGEDILFVGKEAPQGLQEVHFVYQGRCEAYEIHEGDASYPGLRSAPSALPTNPASPSNATCSSVAAASADTGGSCDEPLSAERAAPAHSEPHSEAATRVAAATSAATAHPSSMSVAITTAATASAATAADSSRLAVFGPGYLFGLSCLFHPGGSSYRVCSSQADACFIFVLRQATIDELAISAPEMARALRIAVTDAFVLQVSRTQDLLAWTSFRS